ncbi:MotA/TolQ/ExbB proton channel family protein [bacterium]|nr:MotA/TolQ/ExbB proton channel family protein [bacterium]MBU1984663.1 MotA/TolQ/ExbB proton channel family protein [bacterium]
MRHRSRFWTSPVTYLLAAAAFVMSFLYHGLSHAQTGRAQEYITMSERIGRIIVQYRAFDVWIYFFQGLLFFLCLGFTIYYLLLFHRTSFMSRIRQKLSEMTRKLDMQAAIEFEINSLSNKFLFLDLVITGAPVAGLVGTVVGLVRVFSQQTIVEHVSMQSIAGGMYVAMVTTVVGLLVALVGIIARHLLDSRLAEIRDMLSGAR